MAKKNSAYVLMSDSARREAHDGRGVDQSKSRKQKKHEQAVNNAYVKVKKGRQVRRCDYDRHEQRIKKQFTEIVTIVQTGLNRILQEDNELDTYEKVVKRYRLLFNRAIQRDVRLYEDYASAELQSIAIAVYNLIIDLTNRYKGTTYNEVFNEKKLIDMYRGRFDSSVSKHNKKQGTVA